MLLFFDKRSVGNRGPLVCAVGAAALLALVLVPRVGRAVPRLSKDQRYAVEHGHVLDYADRQEGASAISAHSIAVVDDIPEAVMHVILDVARYRYWVPKIKESRVTKRRGWSIYSVVETDLPWPVKDAWAYLKLTRQDRPGRVFEARWEMLNGTMKRYSGSVRVEPYKGNPKKSFVTYRLTAELKTAVPDAAIRKGVKAVVRVFVQRLKLRLRALRKFKKLSPALLQAGKMSVVSDDSTARKN